MVAAELLREDVRQVCCRPPLLRDVRPAAAVDAVQADALVADLGFGRIVVSEIEVPNMLENLV